MRPWHLEQAVAGVVAQGRIEGCGVEARDRVPDDGEVRQVGEAEPQVERQVPTDLPGIRDVRLEVLPALMREQGGRLLDREERHALEEKGGQDVARRRPVAAESRVLAERRALGPDRSLVLLVEAVLDARLEEMPSERPGIGVPELEEVQPVVPRERVEE